MRPSSDVPDGALFECLECGTRTTASARGARDDCGGPLRNLAVERDL